jgi:hypothetical protein
VVFQNPAQEMGFELAHGLVHADSADHHFADEIVEPPV